MRHPLMYTLAWYLAWAGGAGCEAPDAPTYPVTFRARDGQAPLPGVKIRWAGAVQGTTGRDGSWNGRLDGHEGAVRTVQFTCPPGYEAAGSGEARVRLQRIQPLVTRPASPRAPLHVMLRCRSKLRAAAVVIRAEVPGLEIEVDGERRGRTGPGGIAHLWLRGMPGSEVVVTLDTRNAPRLRPRSPSRSFRFTREDELWVWDQAFAKARRRRRPANRKLPPAPYRLE